MNIHDYAPGECPDCMECPHCGTANPPLGALGRLLHYRCRACGVIYHRYPVEEVL